MSNLAYAQPAPGTLSPREEPKRQVEIVSTRAQRRARPRPIYALIAISGLFALFMAQLLMSIVVSDGAYQISSLQSQQSDLTRQQQSLGEKVDTLASTQNLAVKAEGLGMVQSKALPAFLDVATGTVTGTSHSAKDAASGTPDTTNNLVPNALLPDATAADATTTSASTVVDPTDPPASGATKSTAATEDPNATAVADPASATALTASAGAAAGAPAARTTTAPVASQSGLPIPVTR
ncbi:hypothetical protein BH11ACT2_BH11ACT2_23580 [soil metagenome]